MHALPLSHVYCGARYEDGNKKQKKREVNRAAPGFSGAAL